MKKERKQSMLMFVFGLILVIGLILANLASLLFTIDLTVEQIGSSWGDGTRIEMLALIPWMIELACLPLVGAGAAYLILHVWFASHRGFFIANVALYVLLLAQYVLTNLFLFY
jgi:hypothetical protein